MCSISYTENIFNVGDKRESDVIQTNMATHSFWAGNITENQLQVEAGAWGHARCLALISTVIVRQSNKWKKGY